MVVVVVVVVAVVVVVTWGKVNEKRIGKRLQGLKPANRFLLYAPKVK